MIYSEFQGKRLSLLGFGAMRLPTLEGGAIDEAQVAEMTRAAMESGVNYFDTAWPYHNGESERVMGRVLSAYPRDSWYLASKYPGHQILSGGYDPAAIFEAQLKKCGVDHFDFYLLHNVFEKSMETYLDTLGKLREERADLFLVAHRGIYEEILPFIDLELTVLTRRMLDLLELVEDYTTPKLLTAAICRTYRVRPGSIRTMAYFEQASQTYLHYLTATGHLEAVVEEGTIRYRRTEASKRRAQARRESVLPQTGQFR